MTFSPNGFVLFFRLPLVSRNPSNTTISQHIYQIYDHSQVFILPKIAQLSDQKNDFEVLLCLYMYFDITRIDCFAVLSIHLFKTVDWV